MRRQARLASVVAGARVALAMTIALALPTPGPAEVVITHDGVDCVVAGVFPVIQARLEPPGEVAGARVYFHARGTPHWYYVDMKSEGDAAYQGILPRPLESLEGLDYYIETLTPSFVQGRSQEYSARVIRDSESCPVGGRAAITMSSVPSALLVGAPEGAPAIPPGFSDLGLVSGASGAGGSATSAAGAGGTSTGGISTGVLVGIGAAAAAAGIAVAVTGSGSDGAMQDGQTSGGASPGGTPEPAPTPTPAPDVSGRWAGSFVENPSTVRCTVTSDLSLDLQQNGTNVTGTFQLVIRTATSAPGDPCPVGPGDALNGPASGTVNGDTIVLQLQIPGGGPALVLPGTISDGRMGGTDPEGGGSWEVTRQ
jgi:hypothetical protein